MGVNASRIHAAIPMNVTLEPETFLSTYVYGAITLSGSAFQLLPLASKISYLTRSLTGVVRKKNDLSKDRYFFLVVC